MADEVVKIKIEVASDDSAIDKTRRKLERLGRTEGTSHKRDSKFYKDKSEALKKYGQQEDKLIPNTTRKWKHHFDQVDKMVVGYGKGLLKFVAMSAKMAALEMGALGVAMMAVHATFAAGNFVMKAYRGAMRLAAGGVAGLVIALGTAAAAIREQQAAMYAFTMNNNKRTEFGTTINMARVNMRMLTNDTQMAAVGAENLAAAYGTIYEKAKRVDANSVNMLKGLMDFASAGQDMKTGTKAAAGLVGELQNVRATYGSIRAAALQLGPTMKEALRQYDKEVARSGGKGKNSKEKLIEAITSGHLAELGGVTGQFEAVNGTLLNQAKSYFAQLKNMFADFGQTFLAPVKKEMGEVFRIIVNDFNRVSGQISNFGTTGGFIDKISVVVQKMSDFFIKLFRNYLPGVQGMFSKMGDWWEKFKLGFNMVKEKLRPMIDGARVIENMLKNTLSPIWEQIKNKFGDFRRELLNYQPVIEEFGTKIGVLISKFLEYGSEVRKVFMDALPFINKIVDGVTMLVEQFTSAVGWVQKLTKSLGSGGSGSFGLLATLIGVGRGMKNNPGGFMSVGSMSGIREAANMSVNAGTVYVNGRPAMSYGREQYGYNTYGGQLNRMDTMSGYTLPFNLQPGAPRGFMSPSMMNATNDPFAVYGEAAKKAGELSEKRAGKTKDFGYREMYDKAAKEAEETRGRVLAEMTAQKVGMVQGPEGQWVSIGGTPVKVRKSGPVKDRVTIGGRTTEAMSGGVWVPPESRENAFGRKRYTAEGRIISRRESFNRYLSENQKLGGSGFANEGFFKNAYDRNVRDTRLGRLLARRGQRRAQELTDPENRKYLQYSVQNTQGYWGKTGDLSTVATTGPGSSVLRPDSRLGKIQTAFYKTKLYNNLLAAESGGAAGPLEPSTRVGRAYLNSKNMIRRSRVSRLGENIFGNGKDKKGFQNSAIAGMGTSIGMNLVSSRMDESAQGSMALGASLASSNPLLGLGVGFGGAALNARTAKGGAGMGAAAGAAIGTMIAPGIGTAIGAVIGAIGGGIKGYFNRLANEKKAAKDAAKSAQQSIYTAAFGEAATRISNQGGKGSSALKDVLGNTVTGYMQLAQEASSLLGTGSEEDKLKWITNLYDNQKSYGIKLSEKQRNDMYKNKGATLEQFANTNSKEFRVATDMNETYAKRLKELTKITGLSEMEVEGLAKTMDFNLMDTTKSFTEVLDGLGLAMVKTKEQMQGIQMDSFIGNLSAFDEALKQIEAPLIVDEKAAVFRSKLDSTAGVTDKDQLEFFKSILPDIANLAGGGFAGALKAREMYGRGGTAFTQQEGGVQGYLYGKENTVYGGSGVVGSALDKVLNQQGMDASRNLAGFVNNSLLMGNTATSATGGKRFSINADLFGSRINQMSQGTEEDKARALALSQSVENNTLFAGVNMGDEQAINARLSQYGVTGADVGLNAIASDKDMSSALADISDLGPTIEQFAADFKPFFESQKTTDEALKSTLEDLKTWLDEHADTTTPRGKGIGDTTSSRLTETMGRHQMLDSALLGTRTVTSAYRNYQLGSSNSDHVTGRAYDLTGQQLGAYANLVRQGGGFAEFHGRGNTRHLHVVPGSGAVGDTGVPMSFGAPRTSGSSGHSVTNNYNMTITGGSGANPEQIANAVMKKIKAIQSNERQRS